MVTNDLGRRIREYRQLRGLTVRTCAQLAGMSPSMLSRVERGERSLQRREHVDGLGAALRVSGSELLGQPYRPEDRERSSAHGPVEGIRAALMGTEVGVLPDVEPWRSLADLESLSRRSRRRLYVRGDVAGAAVELPDLLTQLHVHAAAGEESDQVRALRALVLACCTATSAAKAQGYAELAWIAATRARQAALVLGDVGLLGMADFYVSYATQPYALAYVNSVRGLERVEPHTGRDATTMQVAGMLHLMIAFDAAVVGRGDEVRAHLAAVDDLARRTGDTADLELFFGPTNAAIWQVAIAVEQGEGGQARTIARRTNVAAVMGLRRQAIFYLDVGRALAQDRCDQEALRALLHAERLTPVEIRNSPLTHQLVIDLLPRMRRTAEGAELRGLALRVGIT